MNSANIRPLLGLLGVLVAALSADLNEFVSAAALIDVPGRPWRQRRSRPLD
jgi:hypothetical protein